MEVFPAHAGMIPRNTEYRCFICSVPRTRGDDPLVKCMLARHRLVFPAHAGMIPSRSGVPERLLCVPRTRGDDPCELLISELLILCSPHTRG